MKVILSPTKTLKCHNTSYTTLPLFDKEAEKLRKSISSLSLKHIQTFFKCSKEVAIHTKHYFQDQNRYQALYTYDGIGFRTLLTYEPIDYSHLYIVSGLYGLLRPTDGMKPYRLDVIHPKKGSLIGYWKPKLFEQLKHEDHIYLCVSQEYEVLFDRSLPLVFIDIRVGDKKAPSVEAKKVRAALSHYLLKHHGAHIENFEYDNYFVASHTHQLISIKKR